MLLVKHGIDFFIALRVSRAVLSALKYCSLGLNSISVI